MAVTSYAVIESAGRHAAGAPVTPVFTTTDLQKARHRAARLTREHQAKFVRYGGTSGGYVVVEGGPESSWLGWEADLLPRL